MINKEGKLFGKISIIDILVIIVVIAMALGIYMRFFNTPETVEVKSQKFTYFVRVENVRSFSVDALNNMGGIYDEKTKEYLGDIKNIKIIPAKDTGFNSRGEAVLVDYPERHTVILEVEADGKVGENGYYTQSNRAINVGSSLHFESKYIETTGDVISISK